MPRFLKRLVAAILLFVLSGSLFWSETRENIWGRAIIAANDARTGTVTCPIEVEKLKVGTISLEECTVPPGIYTYDVVKPKSIFRWTAVNLKGIGSGTLSGGSQAGWILDDLPLRNNEMYGALLVRDSRGVQWSSPGTPIIRKAVNQNKPLLAIVNIPGKHLPTAYATHTVKVVIKFTPVEG